MGAFPTLALGVTAISYVPNPADYLGATMYWLDVNDPDKAAVQLDKHYQHGGGWSPMSGWTLNPDESLKYPGDSKIRPAVRITFREEIILVYESAWFCIVQPDGSFEVARMD